MPHIYVQCHPKHLSDKQLDDFQKDLTAFAVKHLQASEGDVSIRYDEIPAEQWQSVWDKDIQPYLHTLLKKPDYEMSV